MRRSVVLAAALGLDLAFGEPPAALHPVVWFGKLVALLERRAARGTPAAALASGAALTALSLTAVWGAARAAEGVLAGAPTIPALLAEAWLLKTMLSRRALAEAALAVQKALSRDDLAAARAGLRSLVSRDAAALDASLVAAAAVESVAENANDALVAPALAYLAFGLPGAAVYRGVNTLDAMLGYHGAFEWLGKPAARLDDLANLLPARLTAGLFVLAAVPAGRAGPAALTAQRDHRLTASPNAGWPMAAMAGALGVALEKRGHYRLGKAGRSPQAGDIGSAVLLLRRVALQLLVLVAILEALDDVRHLASGGWRREQPRGLGPEAAQRCRR